MEAVKCKLCGERHWSTSPCAAFRSKAAAVQAVAAVAVKVREPVTVPAPAVNAEPVNVPAAALDKKAAQRERMRLYMAKRRAEAKAAKGAQA